MVALVLLVFATVGASVANVCLRQGMRNLGGLGLVATARSAIQSGMVWLGLFTYVSAAAAWVVVLSMMDLGVAYPAYVGGSFATAYFGSVVFLKERLDVKSLLGAIIVFVGIVIAV